MLFTIDTDSQLIIFDYLDFVSKLNLKNVSKYSRANFQITDLFGPYNADTDDFDSIPGLHKLNNSILRQYPNLEELYAGGNSFITDINFLTKLKVLCCSFCDGAKSGIGDCSIKDLNLSHLFMHNNDQITCVNHMTNLKVLHAQYTDFISGLKSNGIQSLNLVQLNVMGNSGIKIISHLTNLRILDISRNSAVDDDQLSKLTMLTQLTIFDNDKISNIRHLTRLRRLIVNSNTTDTDILNMNLEVLEIFNNNSNIKQISHMTNMCKLTASGPNCIINDSSIHNLVNLTSLNISYNMYITSLNHLTNLTELTAIVNSHLRDAGICQINLKKLIISCTKYIKKICHMTNLEHLDIGNSAVRRLGNFPNLTKLDISGCSHVNNINHLTSLTHVCIDRDDTNIFNITDMYDEGLCLINPIELSINNNPNITNINHMTNLRKLFADDDCGLTNWGIRNLDLEFLSISNNTRITNINHMTNLKTLVVNGNFKIRYDGIEQLLKFPRTVYIDADNIDSLTNPWRPDDFLEAVYYF